MKNKKLVSMLGMAMLAVTLFAGCGGDGNNSAGKGGFNGSAVTGGNSITPEFSAENGIDLSSVENVAWQYGGFFERKSATEVGDFIDEVYYANDNGKAATTAIPRDEVDCILGITTAGDGTGDTRFGKVFGSKSLLRAQSVLQTDKGTEVNVIYKRNLLSDTSEDDLYGVELVFVNGYNYSGITKDSSVNDILNAGFVESSTYGEYFKIYSDAAVDMSKYDSDFESIYSQNYSNAKALQGGYSAVDYGRELLSARFIFNDPISANDKQRDFGIGEVYDASLEMFIKQAELDRYAEKYNFDSHNTVKQECAIAEQWHKLRFGEIEYFAIVEIETHPAELDLDFGAGAEGRRISFDTNVCHVYLFSNKETVLKWLSQWGF